MADAERAMRSVFVGNIPYEVTEEKLKEIFSEAGPVQSLKLVYDRDTGKPKGYGFCEYKDAETAMSAMRNLNGYEISGRTLRVDNAGAAGHRVTEMGNGPRHNEPEMNQFGGYGDEGPPPPEKAPEAIAKTVASLPPEQMFELMKQMKMCIQNNPNEARTMLLQNPQLAYALLQALVVMKIVDPTVAISMLHKDSSVPIGSLLPEGQMGMMPGSMPGPAPPQQQTENPWLQAVANQGAPLMPMNPPGPFGAGPMGGSQGPPQSADLDMRAMDPRLRGAPVPPSGKDFDLRDPRAGGFGMDPRRDRGGGDRDRDLRDPRSSAPSSAPDPRDPRSRRGDSSSSSSSNTRPSAQQPPINPLAGLAGPSGEEQQRLIKLVMNLSDEQIRQLPAEQQQSIKMLKDQIARSKPNK